jgi:hypothetical protein
LQPSPEAAQCAKGTGCVGNAGAAQDDVAVPGEQQGVLAVDRERQAVDLAKARHVQLDLGRVEVPDPGGDGVAGAPGRERVERDLELVDEGAADRGLGAGARNGWQLAAGDRPDLLEADQIRLLLCDQRGLALGAGREAVGGDLLQHREQRRVEGRGRGGDQRDEVGAEILVVGDYPDLAGRGACRIGCGEGRGGHGEAGEQQPNGRKAAPRSVHRPPGDH